MIHGREARRAIRRFFRRPKGKWDVLALVWERSIILGFDGLLWAAGFFSGNAVYVLGLHLIAGCVILVLILRR